MQQNQKQLDIQKEHAIADEMEGRAQSELDRMKDEGLFDD
jgi:hypothetical protein